MDETAQLDETEQPDETAQLTITEMAVAAGISADTLRWYEREGILPRVARTSTGHRRYGARERGLVLLLIALRDTGMSTAGMKHFVELLGEGAASHGRRITLLEEGQALLEVRRQELELARVALDAKMRHYEDLIAQGLDCDGAPVTEEVQKLQVARV